MILAVLAAVPWLAAGMATAETADALVGTWRGSYGCIQGDTGLLITITDVDGLSFEGEFAFYALPDNPSVPDGRFAITGTYHPRSRGVEIEGARWLQRPNDYSTAGLSGTLSEDQRTIAGKVLYSGCAGFHLTIEGDPRPAKKSKNNSGS
jgi:hypothetical protein